MVEQLADTISIDSAYYAQDIPETMPGNLVDPVSQPVRCTLPGRSTLAVTR